MQPATVPVPSPHRFFALTAERLELIARHSLTMADVSVWAFVELASKPGALKRFTVATVAKGAHVSLSAAKRSITRLAELGLIIKRRRSHGLWLCPASAAFDHLPEKPRLSAGEVSPVSYQRSSEVSALVHQPASDSSGLTLHDGVNLVAASSEATLSEDLELQRESSKAFNLKEETTETASPPLADDGQDGNGELLAELERTMGIWSPAARRLVATYGVARVGECLGWADWLKGQGRASNPGGWLQAALRGSYGPPEGFHEAKQSLTPERRPLDQAAVIARVMTIRGDADRYTADEKTEALRNACLVGEDAAAMRLAAVWGVDL